MDKVTTLLCPTDFSDNSLAALRYAAEMARALGAGIELLHVYHLPLHKSDQYAPESVAGLDPKVRDGIQRDFNDLIAELGGELTGIPVATRLEVGVPYEKIAERAERDDIDMVVLSHLGRSGITRLLLGSVAERTVRICNKPVLTVPLAS